MGVNRWRQVWADFQSGFTGDQDIANALLPPLMFLLLDRWLGFTIAAPATVGGALVIAGARLAFRLSPRYALGGLAMVSLEVLVAWLVGAVEGYFIPGVLMGWVWAAAAAGSALIGRPLAAYTSHLAHRWPLDWYWHPRVRPAYGRVTWLWAAFLAGRSALQVLFFQARASWALYLSAWPATIVFLWLSFLAGRRWLRALCGPGVEEFEAGAGPPWIEQGRGF